MGQIMKIYNNGLIAEFMEVETCSGHHEDEGPCYWDPSSNRYLKDYQLKYDTSYDWLIPVVNKCIKIYHTDRQDIFNALTNADDIEILYNSVVKFIEKYNDPNEPWCVAIGYPAPPHKLKTT